MRQNQADTRWIVTLYFKTKPTKTFTRQSYERAKSECHAIMRNDHDLKEWEVQRVD